MRTLARSDCPAALARLRPAADARVQVEIEAGKVKDLSFTQTTYAHAEVRAELDRLQFEKCAYCETLLRPATLGDIEHFRPKGEVLNEETEQKLHPGYYWLAHEWSNLLLSCNWCNTKAKGTRFPVAQEQHRQRLPAMPLVPEDAMLLDPYEDAPRARIRFNSGYIYASPGDAKADKTIDVLQLDRDDLNVARRKAIRIVKALIHAAKTAPIDADRQEARELVVEYFSPRGEYACCINDNFDLQVEAADWRADFPNFDQLLEGRPVVT